MYLTGLLTLNYSLRRVGSKYPLVVLHFGSLSDEAVRTLTDRGIPLQKVPYIYPGMPWPEGVAGSSSKAHDNEDANGNNTNGGGSTNQWYAYERFRDCFTKLAAFSLTAYSRIVLLDADMLVLRNMDDLFDVPLDNENRLFAATRTSFLLFFFFFYFFLFSHSPPTSPLWLPRNSNLTLYGFVPHPNSPNHPLPSLPFHHIQEG